MMTMAANGAGWSGDREDEDGGERCGWGGDNEKSSISSPPLINE